MEPTRSNKIGDMPHANQQSAEDGAPRNGQERRQRKRYNLRLPATVALAGSSRSWAGWTVDISSAGIRIASEDLPPDEFLLPGAPVAISLDWPVWRDGPIRLLVSGNILRSASRDFASSIRNHHFE